MFYVIGVGQKYFEKTFEIGKLAPPASCINFADRKAFKSSRCGLFYISRVILDFTNGEVDVLLDLIG